jgi:beta-fructofuranosidase
VEKETTKPTRRLFLRSAAAAATIAAAPHGIFAESAKISTLASDPMRPQFHLLPAKNWMNDPNGPIYFKGNYHMFFQYNPQAAVWGNMSWNHAISKDMLHWTLLPLALTPTPGSVDAYGCFSGSAITVNKRVYMVYTGTVKSTPALATIHADGVQESQCLAWSDDPSLIHWTKDPTPIVALPPERMAVTGFRDPSVWRQHDSYYMTVGSSVENAGGCVLLYRSKDLKHWDYLHTLTSGKWNGKKTPNPCDDGELWECPDFFALNGGHVLIYSTLGKVIWQSGRLDEVAMVFHPLKSGELDLEAFYAPKTQLDARGRRILWGWIKEQRSDDAMRAAGWSGMMSLPRVLNLDADGTLHMQMLPSISALRTSVLPQQNIRAGMQIKLPKATGEVVCTGSATQDFAFTMSTGATELLQVTYSAEKHAFVIDGREIVLQPNDATSLHAFVDGSVIELIVGERIGYTKRFYYTQPTAPDIVVVANGTGPIKMGAWKIASISNNRLTTPPRKA